MALPACGQPRAAPPLQPQPVALPTGFHAGMGLAHLHRRGVGYGSAACEAQLARLAALGVKHVALTPFAYVRGVDSASFHYGSGLDPTLTDADLIEACRQARSLGMSVCLKPHVWSNAFWGGDGSRQDMRAPDGDWDAWFAAYTRFAVRYARVAEQAGAELYVVGLEYLQASLAGGGRWAAVADACRTVYGGALTYAANWWREAEAFGDWQAFDLVGVNAYHDLVVPDDPDVDELVDAWEKPLDGLVKLGRETGKSVLLTEVGVRAVRGAAAQSWNQSLGGTDDPELQARFYEAVLRAVAARPTIRGVYWWKWFTDWDRRENDAYVPGEAAQEVIRAWWGAA